MVESTDTMSTLDIMNEILVLMFVTQDEKNKDALGTLLYADIGQPQFRQQILLLHIPHLDDDAVEYAKLDQHMLTPAAATKVESEVNGIKGLYIDS